MADYNLEDVFGSSREIPINYVKRNEIDDNFIRSLSREQHIVIFGSAKQGKTCLRKKHLPDEENYIFIQCSEKLNLSKLNKQILKRAGIDIKISEKKGNTNAKKVKAKIGFNLFVNKASAEGELKRENSAEVETRPIQIDLVDTNDIIHVLSKAKFNKFIILDEFHSLNKTTQKDLAIALKAYHENSKIKFIIIGVWLDNNRLVALNGNLAGRITSINVDNWSQENLMEVIDEGANLLNIEFDQDLKERIIEESFDNVYFVQEICYRICDKFRIKATQLLGIDGKRVYISNNFDVKEICKQAINQYSGRYNEFITQFSEGTSDDKLNLHKWLLYTILTSKISDLQAGLKIKEILYKIKASNKKANKISKQKIRKILYSCVSFQTSKEISPVIIDFDKSLDRLTIIDKEFFIWLTYQDKKQLSNSLELKIKKK